MKYYVLLSHQRSSVDSPDEVKADEFQVAENGAVFFYTKLPYTQTKKLVMIYAPHAWSQIWSEES